MRLIDADVLIEAINKSTCNWAEHLWKRVVCDVIGNQSTAYDVEKVVEQIKKVNNICDECKHKRCELCRINEICEVVRKGGVNDGC